jgi:hypothetical protein
VSYDAATHTCLVALDTGQAHVLLPVAGSVPGALLVENAFVIVGLASLHNPEDGIVLAPYGASPPPGVLLVNAAAALTLAGPLRLTGGTAAGGQGIRQEAVSALADGASFSLCAGGYFIGLLHLVDQDGRQALYLTSLGTITEVADPASAYTPTDTPGGTCILYSGAGGIMQLKNRTGAAHSYWVTLVGYMP